MGRNEFDNIIGIWCKKLKLHLVEVAESRVLSSTIRIAKVMRVYLVIIEGYCKLAIDYIQQNHNQL